MQITCMSGRKRLFVISAVTCLVLLLTVNGLVAAGKPHSAFEGDSSSGFTTKIGTEEDTIRRATYYDRTNYDWSFESGPFYGEVNVAEKRMPGTLHTQVGSFRPGQRDLGIPAALRATNRLGELGAQYFVIQLDNAAFGTQEAVNAFMGMIQSGGGAVMTPMAISSYLVRLTPDAMAAVEGHSGVTHIEPYHPAFKLNPEIGRQPLSDPFRATSEIYTLDLMLHQGEDAGVVASILAGMGGNVLVAHDSLIRVEIHRSKLAAVAGLEPVFMVEEWQKQFSRAEETTNVIQTGYYFAGGIEAPSPYHNAGIRGAGQVLMVLDSGVSIDAGDMSDTSGVAGTPGPLHRKVLVNAATTSFGGFGDTQSCDDPLLGGSTHGQIVSATALGWATDVDPAYGTGWFATDIANNQFALDGVAPEAKLVFYDGNQTPATGNCGDAENDGISPGDLYAGGSTGSLGVSHDTHGAKVTNFSWGSPSNTYSTNAIDIDTFLNDKEDALVFVSAGNAGSDEDSNGIPDLGTLGTPATCKNCLAIGASGNANSNGARRTERDRAFFSSSGPTPLNRVAPQLMAPGQERGGLGVPSEFACRSNDNDQTGTVECDVTEGSAGTSFASPAAAGAALLVRDYFASGFYPDGTDGNPSNAGDQRANISGSLVKAVLIAGADFMAFPGNVLGANNTIRYRFNNEQGYGRIQLDNVLPLAAWSLSPVGIIVKDGGLTGDVFGDLSGLSGVMPLAGGTQTETFQLCDDTQELRIALAWMEAQGDALLNDLDLEIQDPDGNIYYGNYFTDDNNKDGTLNAGEDCPAIDGANLNVINSGPWSLPTCGNSVHDTENPTEAVMLSPDPDYNLYSLVCSGDGTTSCRTNSDCATAGGTCSVADAFNQLVTTNTGPWTIRVIGSAMSADTNYAVVITGGVCNDSSVRFDAGNYVCNDTATITVNDIDSIDDPQGGLNGGEISTRVTVDVIADDGVTVMDTETGLTFTQQGSELRFTSEELQMSNGTQFDPGNGVLDVRHGQSIRVTYQDESTDGGVLPGDIKRVATSVVDCTTAINFGSLVFGKIGANGIFSIDGGCEQNLRGGFEFGFPDEYMDAGESVGYGLAFSSNESETLVDAIASLRCVEADGDSPEDCLPGTSDCADPNRENNPPCAGVTVTDSPKVVGDIPVGSAMAAYFNVTMAGSLTSGSEVEMILGISSPAAGKSTPGLAISRHVLDVDESSTYYSTDFPTGGSQIKDYNNNEIEDIVTTDLGDPNLDYRIETWTWGNPSSTNPDLVTFAPWDFDANNGGFQVGVTSSSDTGLIVAQPTLWGEDLNFDGLAQGGEATRDPAGTGSLDYGYSTLGGCGWQTKTGLPAGDGGVWHTGLIGNNSGSTSLTNCLADGDSGPNRCQATESGIGTINGDLLWFELLVTPVINKVNGANHTVEMVDFAWNMTQDIANDLEAFSWELDNDIDKLEPLDLKSDSTVSGLAFGAFGPVVGGGNPALGSPAHAGLNAGFAMFTQYVEGGAENFNGTVGNNRVGSQSCWFSSSKQPADLIGPFGTALPLDDDVDNDTDGQTDEFVTANGPLRNYDLSAFNGPDLRVTTWEDLFGDSGNSFQAALGYVVLEGTPSDLATEKSYGATVDDVVIEWREYELVPDGSNCAGSGECASLDLQALNFFEGAALIQVTSIERTPPAANDCNFDGDVLDINDDTDCDDNGVADILVEVYSATRDDSEVIYLNNTGNATNPNEYKGPIPISPTFDVDGQLVNGHFEGGVLFIVQNGTSNPIVQVDYVDDGCNDNPDPTKTGIRFASTTVFMPIARMNVASYTLTDDNDFDGYADAGETVNMLITLKNNVNVEYKNVVARLSTNSPNIECITGSSASIGTMGPLAAVTAATPFTFKVADTVDRLTTFEDLTAQFAITVSGDAFDTLIQPIGLVMDLDLDITNPGAGPSTFTESFDGGTFGQFTTMNLDGLGVSGSNSNSDGYRCQYSDPDFINANAYGRIMCYLGNNRTNPLIGDTIYEFHVHTPAQPDGGRSFSGANSMHLGTHSNPSNAGFDTTSLGQLDALVTTNPVNLSTAATSELSFKHQISMIDDRTVNSPGNETPDRAIVMVKKVNNSGVEQGVWIKVAPYKNVYHIQGTDNFTECVFDPIDDGSTEDDFFDPTDPFRRTGPSSTCFPEFVYTDLGNTTFDAPFDANLTGRATEVGGGLEGNSGPGTWVESKFDLARFRGFRLKVRFLYTSIAVDSGATNYNQLFGLPEGWPGDDGWYVDDVSINNTLTTAATLAPDATVNNPSNICGAGCSGIATALSSDLADALHVVAAPGGVITLTAEASTVDSCVDGTLQYQFWTDDDLSGTLDSVNDTLLRDWTDYAFYTDVPAGDTDYAVITRCTSSPASCTGTNTAFLSVTVNCPSSGNLGFNSSVGVDAAKANLTWGVASTIDAIEGSLDTLLSAGFATSVNTCLADNVSTNTVSIANTPAAGSGLYYLVRGTGAGVYCNEGSSTWGSAARDTDLSGAANVCP